MVFQVGRIDWPWIVYLILDVLFFTIIYRIRRMNIMDDELIYIAIEALSYLLDDE